VSEVFFFNPSSTPTLQRIAVKCISGWSDSQRTGRNSNIAAIGLGHITISAARRNKFKEAPHVDVAFAQTAPYVSKHTHRINKFKGSNVSTRRYHLCPFCSTCQQSKAIFSLLPFHIANKGPVRIQYKCLVRIYVFPEMKLLCLVISKTELQCSVSQFPHSCICEQFIHSQDRYVYFAAAK
jgi:hypothetical protein